MTLDSRLKNQIGSPRYYWCRTMLGGGVTSQLLTVETSSLSDAGLTINDAIRVHLDSIISRVFQHELHTIPKLQLLSTHLPLHIGPREPRLAPEPHSWALNDMAGTRKTSSGRHLPQIYELFFLWIEPLSALVGAYYAHFKPEQYLQLTHAGSAPSSIPLGTRVALSQLGNLYAFFALNEALVLRSTSDLAVWRTVLFVLLIADLGHLYTVKELGWPVFYDVASWNAIDWGNVPFVYFGAAMRVSFLAGLGLKKTRRWKRP